MEQPARVWIVTAQGSLIAAHRLVALEVEAQPIGRADGHHRVHLVAVVDCGGPPIRQMLETYGDAEKVTAGMHDLTSRLATAFQDLAQKESAQGEARYVAYSETEGGWRVDAKPSMPDWSLNVSDHITESFHPSGR